MNDYDKLLRIKNGIMIATSFEKMQEIEVGLRLLLDAFSEESKIYKEIQYLCLDLAIKMSKF